ncbi:MAG: hypothetical protein M1828_007019 [Chrysothrix sp. TS-e1954]|nr:MAG: hypothetical protein M1828_007019 [Chrysothrix sp. TS-e1954]
MAESSKSMPFKSDSIPQTIEPTRQPAPQRWVPPHQLQCETRKGICAAQQACAQDPARNLSCSLGNYWQNEVLNHNQTRLMLGAETERRMMRENELDILSQQLQALCSEIARLRKGYCSTTSTVRSQQSSRPTNPRPTLRHRRLSRRTTKTPEVEARADATEGLPETEGKD